MKRTYILLLAVLASCGGKNYRNADGGIIVSGRTAVTAVSERIIRVGGETDERFKECDVEFTVEETDTEVSLSTARMKAVINVSDGTAAFYTKDGKKLESGRIYGDGNASVSTDNWGTLKEDGAVYMITGDSMDDVVAGIRQLTGNAAVPPKWALGCWQKGTLDMFGEMREKHLSVDNLICDGAEKEKVHALHGHLASTWRGDAEAADAWFCDSVSVSAKGRTVQICNRVSPGSQKSGAVFLRKTVSTWEELRKEVFEGPGRSLMGNPYWCTSAASDDPELEERWYQLSAFLPVSLFCGKSFPDSHYAKLRYALHPYIYTLCGKAFLEGYTMTRPLVMDFPTDSIACAVDDQYMFGPSLMVCPVYGKGQRSRKVYFPAGRIWYDYNHPSKIYEGGTTATVEAPLDRIPVFVPGGGILAIGQRAEYYGEVRKNDRVDLDIDIYAGQDGHFKIYDDDGVYGSYCIVPVTYTESPRTVVIEPRVGEYRGMVKARNVHVAVYDNGKMKAINVYYEGQTIKISL